MRNGIDAVSAPLPTLFVSPPAVFTASLERLPHALGRPPPPSDPPGSPGIPDSVRLQTGAATSH